MRGRVKKAVAVAAMAGLAVVGMDAYTYAGTGDSLILGKFNKSHKTTHIKNTGKGPALSLHAKGKRPALKVDSKAKIVKLNADRVDGKNAKALQNNVRIYTATSSPSNIGHVFELPDFPNGRYLATYTVHMADVSGDAYCYFQRGYSDVYAGHSVTSTSYAAIGLSASDVINKDAKVWRLWCAAAGPWSVDSGNPVRVTLTRIDKTIRGQLPVTRRVSPPDRLTGQ